ncbi:hypothetical protein L3Q82_015566 [Scortum barcoo]|uniref:Uncharacterized protein n=1 Tax=Scortum barcoo TaxID=214431 RepID=A0ACB8VRE0_9TELE|nr:hypothetical protein L3Q82_015566 [Scortum barcoo]
MSTLLYFHTFSRHVTDQNRLILRNGNHPCEGHVEIYHKNKRGYVGDKYWNEKTEEVVCRSTSCGEHKTSENVFRPTNDLVWLNEVSCNGTESHLWECDYPGWNISNYRKDTVKKITCSNDIKISLDGFKCAGAVQYTMNGQHSGYICANNWGKNKEGKDEAVALLCKNLGCGTGTIATEPFMVWKGFESQSSQNKIINCADIGQVDNLWQCVTEKTASCQSPVSVICTGHEKLQLSKTKEKNACSGNLEKKENGKWSPVKSTDGRDVWCSHMHCGSYASHTELENTIQLECTDKVTLDLMDNNESTAKKCYGAVHMKVNDTSHPVCATKDWTMENANVVCNELNCGHVVSIEKRATSTKGIMDYVSCTGKESSLWHCDAQHHQVSSSAFTCKDKAHVTCAGSVKVRLKDSPGPCAGRVEILYRGQWKSVAEDGWTETNSDVVCKEVGCGNKSILKPEKFSQGSEHKVLFLEEVRGESCSGTVGIEKGNKIYWLSGSTETWNQESANAVCQQMLCGKAKSFGSTPSADEMKDIWQESYNCLPNSTSLFACEKNTPQPPDHINTTATVKCTGRIEVNLTNKCWGNVNVCTDGICGGVCADAWTDEKSVMLCKNLECGNRVLPKLSTTTGPSQEVIFKSLHTTNQTTQLTQCNFVKYDKNDKTCSRNPAFVICSGSVKSRIKATRDKCSGNVEVQYANQWLPVCTDALKDNNVDNTICRELNCDSVKKTIGYFGPVPASGPVISQIQCPGSGDESLKNCTITSAPTVSCTLAGLQCSSWKKMALENSEKSCSGNVVIRSEGEMNSVSLEGWKKTEGNKLCQSLDCGNMVSISNKTYISNLPLSSSFSCAGTQNPESSIWDCEGQSSPSQKEHLYVECQDEPNVILSKGCHGEVRINNIQVCAAGWNDDYSHLVCQEKDCSNAIASMDSLEKAKPNKEYYHVSCEKHHYKLGQCRRFKAKCETNLVSVYCVRKSDPLPLPHSVNFSTSERCGGQIKVSYEGGRTWEDVCPTSLSTEFMDKLCKHIGCEGHNAKISKTKTSQQANLQTTLSFTENCKDIKHSVKRTGCKNVLPAEIYCKGYVIKDEAPSKVKILPIILGVGSLLVLVILLVVFARLYITRRAKKAMNAMTYSSRTSSRKDEFESGEYEDVLNKENEMEDGRGRFRSESEMIMESDARSNTSLNYDDIDEATEVQLLTSQAATGGGTSGNNYMQKDGVTYEVNDPQENYDDIEGPPEISQTTAEVHDGTQPTPESVTGPQLGLVQGDEDYLVPGQDG